MLIIKILKQSKYIINLEWMIYKYFVWKKNLIKINYKVYKSLRSSLFCTKYKAIRI